MVCLPVDNLSQIMLGKLVTRFPVCLLVRQMLNYQTMCPNLTDVMYVLYTTIVKKKIIRKENIILFGLFTLAVFSQNPKCFK